MSADNTVNVSGQSEVTFHSMFTPATKVLKLFGVFDCSKTETVQTHFFRKWLTTALRSLYWGFVLCFLFMDTSSSMYTIAYSILHTTEIQKSSASNHPMVDILCSTQFLIESIRGVVIFGWLKIKGHEILLLIDACRDMADLFHITTSHLLRLRNFLILAVLGVTCLAAVIAGLTAWSWLVFFSDSGNAFAPYPNVPIRWYIAMWMSTSVLLAVLSRFLALVVAFLTLVMCFCTTKLVLELPTAESILENKSKLHYILAEVRFKYLQIVTLAYQMSENAGVVILWGLVCDIVSVCGYVARNFDPDIPEWFLVTITRSMVAGIGIMVCFIFAMHWPFLLLHKQVLTSS
jgi:hypothetical protein